MINVSLIENGITYRQPRMVLYLAEGKEVTLHIGKKIIKITQHTVKQNDEDRIVLSFPRLTTEDKKGNILYMEHFVIGESHHTRHGHVCGKAKYSKKEGKVTNAGKKNEHSKRQNAIHTAAKKWKEDIEKRDYKPIDEDVEEDEVVLDESSIIRQEIVEYKFKNKITRKYPEKTKLMLAEKFSTHGHHIQYSSEKEEEHIGAGVSEKLDGIRANFQIHQDHEKEYWKQDGVDNPHKNKGYVSIISRGNKRYGFLNHLRIQVAEMLDEFGDLSLSLDGELYKHGAEFKSITSAVKRSKTKHPKEKEMEYHIYDVIDPKATYYEREQILQKLREIVDRLELDNIKFVGYKRAESEEDVIAITAEYVEQGYEGSMIRNLSGLYARGRTKDIIKYKDFEDEEFEIVGMVPIERGYYRGCARFECKHPSGETFKAFPKGSLEERKKIYHQFQKNNKKYIGKMLTVRYQKVGLKEGEVPRFGVGMMEAVAVRDYE